MCNYTYYYYCNISCLTIFISDVHSHIWWAKHLYFNVGFVCHQIIFCVFNDWSISTIWYRWYFSAKNTSSLIEFSKWECWCYWNIIFKCWINIESWLVINFIIINWLTWSWPWTCCQCQWYRLMRSLNAPINDTYTNISWSGLRCSIVIQEKCNKESCWEKFC